MDPAASFPAPPVIPSQQTPKLLGTLSIVFASMILLMGLCQGVGLVFAPMFFGLIETTAKKAQDQNDASLNEERKALDAREKVAKTDEERAKIQADRAQLKNRPVVNFSGMGAAKEQLENPTIQGYQIFDLSTSIVLNSLMLASGIGLLRLKRWGRSLAIWVASIKVVRLAILAVVSFTLILPITTAAQKKQFQEMDAQFKANGGPPPGMPAPTEMAKWAVASSAIGSVVMFLLMPIFPIVVLTLLNRPRVLAAFPRPTAVAAKKAETEWEELK